MAGTGFLKNYGGGLKGLSVALLFYAGLYFAAFLSAFGNPTPSSEASLELFASLAPILLPLSYVAGAYRLSPLPGRLSSISVPALLALVTFFALTYLPNRRFPLFLSLIASLAAASVAIVLRHAQVF